MQDRYAGDVGDFGKCEQNFLTIVGLLFTSLSHDKEVNRRKRA